MNYKNIFYTLYSDDTIAEFDLQKNKIVDEKEFVMKMTIFLELIGHARFKKIIFTNGKTFFTLNSRCQNYARRCIIEAIKDYEVETIYFEIPKNDDAYLTILDYGIVTAIIDKYEVIEKLN